MLELQLLHGWLKRALLKLLAVLMRRLRACLRVELRGVRIRVRARWLRLLAGRPEDVQRLLRSGILLLQMLLLGCADRSLICYHGIDVLGRVSGASGARRGCRGMAVRMVSGPGARLGSWRQRRADHGRKIVRHEKSVRHTHRIPGHVTGQSARQLLLLLHTVRAIAARNGSVLGRSNNISPYDKVIGQSICLYGLTGGGYLRVNPYHMLRSHLTRLAPFWLFPGLDPRHVRRAEISRRLQ